MPKDQKSHSEALELVCAVCTNLRGEKAVRKVREGREEELIREHVFPRFLRGYDWYPQGLCRFCIHDLNELSKGRHRDILLPSDYSCTLPRQLRSSPPGPCMCRCRHCACSTSASADEGAVAGAGAGTLYSSNAGGASWLASTALPFAHGSSH